MQLNVNVKRLNLEMSGASETVLSGKAENVEIEASGACEIEAFKLNAKNMFIDISGAGKADVNAKKILDVEISGAGEIRYKGTPKITQDISGSGSIKEAK
jgi:broad-specificity NMP kinase